MHVPNNIKKQAKQKKPIPQWEDNIRVYQEQACRTRCELPTYLRCAADGCDESFKGHTAWDDRMEHVAKHLEKTAAGAEKPFVFGGPNDPTLMEWAMRPDVAVVKADGSGQWKLNNPLKVGGQMRPRVTVQDEDQDAEGEEVDD
jgi:hypothetical protein